MSPSLTSEFSLVLHVSFFILWKPIRAISEIAAYLAVFLSRQTALGQEDSEFSREFGLVITAVNVSNVFKVCDGQIFNP